MSVSTTASLVTQASREGFVQGAAWAIAVCMRGGLEGAGERLLVESGLEVQDFVDAEVDEHDLSQVLVAAKAQARGTRDVTIIDESRTYLNNVR